MLIDTHTHLHDPAYDGDREAVIQRARRSEVGLMISIGTDLENSRKALDLAERYEFVYATVGVHPHDTKDIQEDSYEALTKLAARDKVIAFGEIGLDYYYMHSPKEVQQAHFRGQIGIARRLRLPLIIHMRQASEDTLSILKEQKADDAGGVFHCFTGDLKTAREAIALGFFISFSGILTFPKASELEAVAREVPMERLLIETDCPYLAPVPHRGKRNEPAHVRHVAEKLAHIKGFSYSDMARLTSENARRLFKRIPQTRSGHRL